MATRKTRDIRSALIKKGFRHKDGDHAFYTYHRASDEKKTSIFTKMSHGESEVGDYLLSKMAQQCGLSKSEFLDLVDCPLDQAGYEAKLRLKKVDV